MKYLTGMIGWFGKYPWPVVPAEEPHHTVMKKLDCGHTHWAWAMDFRSHETYCLECYTDAITQGLDRTPRG